MWNSIRLKCWSPKLLFSPRYCYSSFIRVQPTARNVVQYHPINELATCSLPNWMTSGAGNGIITSNTIFNHPSSRKQKCYFATAPPKETGSEEPENLPKPSLYKRFKTMARDYWYVLIPVHVATSCIWFGAFFYAASSGFDIAEALTILNLSDEIMDKVRHSTNSTAGHITLSYLLYKIFTPLRYTVTLGATTYSIKYLTARGLLKKMPRKEEIGKMVKKSWTEKVASSKKSNE